MVDALLEEEGALLGSARGGEELCANVPRELHGQRFWVIAYDTEYAMVDRDDDLRLGMRTSAITFGRYDVLAVAVCYGLYFAGMAWVGTAVPLGALYWTGLAIAVMIAIYHLWLIRTRDRM